MVFEARRTRLGKRVQGWPAPRRDAVATGFGFAFLLLGALGPARAAGVGLPSHWLSPLILIGFGVAGLAGVWSERRQVRDTAGG